MASSDEQELHDRIDALCVSRYGDATPSHMKSLFLSYDSNGDGALNHSEMKNLLADAGVGNFATRGLWVDGIFEKLDKSPADDRVTWEEYLAASSTPSKPPSSDGSGPTPEPPAPPTKPTLGGSYGDGSTGLPSGSWSGSEASSDTKGGLGGKGLLLGAGGLLALFLLTRH